MKVNYKSILITVLLLIVLGVVLFVETGMFISGPQRKYEDDIRKIETTIMKNYRGIKIFNGMYSTIRSMSEKTIRILFGLMN